MKTHISVATIAALAALVSADTTVVLLDPDKFASPGRDFLSKTTIPGDFCTLEGIVGALLTLGDQAADKKLESRLQPLAPLYLGVRKEGDKVILRFGKGAEEILGGTAAEQQTVKGPLEATVRLHCPGTAAVLYEIDGKIFEDWDA